MPYICISLNLKYRLFVFQACRAEQLACSFLSPFSRGCLFQAALFNCQLPSGLLIPCLLLIREKWGMCRAALSVASCCFFFFLLWVCSSWDGVCRVVPGSLMQVGFYLFLRCVWGNQHILRHNYMICWNWKFDTTGPVPKLNTLSLTLP